MFFGEQRWRSGESTRLPPIWPGFKSRRRRQRWVEVVVGSLSCPERFFSAYSGFPLSSKTKTSKFQFEQRWRSGESTRLPPIWPGFKSRRRRQRWVEVVVGSLSCPERFFSAYSGFPLSSKTKTSKFQFDLERSDKFERIHENS